MLDATKTEKLIDLLHKNCKISLEQVAIMLNASLAEVGETIDVLEKNGTFLGYGAIVDWDKVEGEDSVTAIIELKVIPQKQRGFNRLAERICQFPEVKSVYLMSGSYDFSVTLKCKSIRDISMFVTEHLAPMESIQSTATHFVLKRYKNDGIIFARINDDDREVLTI